MFLKNTGNNVKLAISYLMFKNFYKYLYFKIENFNNLSVFIKNNKNYIILLHSRLSTFFSQNQLTDIFTYEIFAEVKISNNNSSNKSSFLPYDSSLNHIIIYNLHNIFSHERTFVFTKITSNPANNTLISTVTELYSNSGWLEREVSETYGIHFAFKKDLRNLMLQYGDTNTPFKKSFPTMGFRETSYDIVVDSIIQNRFDLQN